MTASVYAVASPPARRVRWRPTQQAGWGRSIHERAGSPIPYCRAVAVNAALSAASGGSGASGRQGAAAPGLVISLLGGAAFTFGGREIPLRNRKACAMLAYLALTERGE